MMVAYLSRFSAAVLLVAGYLPAFTSYDVSRFEGHNLSLVIQLFFCTNSRFYQSSVAYYCRVKLTRLQVDSSSGSSLSSSLGCSTERVIYHSLSHTQEFNIFFPNFAVPHTLLVLRLIPRATFSRVKDSLRERIFVQLHSSRPDILYPSAQLRVPSRTFLSFQRLRPERSSLLVLPPSILLSTVLQVWDTPLLPIRQLS